MKFICEIRNVYKLASRLAYAFEMPPEWKRRRRRRSQGLLPCCRAFKFFSSDASFLFGKIDKIIITGHALLVFQSIETERVMVCSEKMWIFFVTC